ncbi:MAG: hypothetical protein INQ03_12685 [Candidatus Heimdallarchaeota archaeon]|nr:hypothetical protein [Candidatus Heimdallarchaeota archaeon]
MSRTYNKENDRNYEKLYSISLILVFVIGLLGMLIFILSLDFDLDYGFLEDMVDNLVDIFTILIPLTLAALIVGWIQVALTSKIGEELILIVIWVTPFLVIATSLYLYYDSNDYNLLGGAIVGLIFLGLVIYFKHSVRLSARLIEVGAEITLQNSALFKPQLYAFLLTSLLSILVIPGTFVTFAFGAKIHGLVAIILVALYDTMFLFVITTIKFTADAMNIAYLGDWYGGTASNEKAKKTVSMLKAPIIKFSFIMAFIERFRSNKQQGFTPFSLFKYMNIKNWPKLLLQGSVSSKVADTVVYFGNYTLVVIVLKKMGSVTQAYQESAKSMFKTFAANIAGSMGFNILDSLRVWTSSILLLAAGGFYGYSVYGDIFLAIITAILFLILGSTPLNSMFKPVILAYRVLLYNSYTKKKSSKLDKKTKDIINAALP